MVKPADAMEKVKKFWNSQVNDEEKWAKNSIQEERSSGKRKERSSIEEETNPSNNKINKRLLSPTKVSLSLNTDMLTEVLSYLPFDAVTRFKSVNKSWLQLIEEPYFVSLRTQRSTSAVLGFIHQAKSGTENIGASLYRRIDKSRRQNLQQLLDGHYIILAACNGLLLVSSFDYNSYFVWNLRMESLKGIPPPPDASYRSPMYGLATAASCLDSYDIVAMDNLSPSGFIYSSRTGVWKPFGTNVSTQTMPTNISLYLNRVGPACARGSLHWLTDDGKICTFDLGKLTLKWMSLPNHAKIRSLGRDYLNIWFGSVGNDLYVVLVSGRNIELWINLEIRCEGYCHWRKLLEVKGSDSKAGAPVFFDGRRIAITTTKEWIEAKAKRWIDLYDIHSKKWEKPHFLPIYARPGQNFVPLVEDKF